MRKGAIIIRGVFVRAAVVAAVAGVVVGIASAGQALASPADQSGAYQVDAAHDGSIADAAHLRDNTRDSRSVSAARSMRPPEAADVRGIRWDSAGFRQVDQVAARELEHLGTRVR